MPAKIIECLLNGAQEASLTSGMRRLTERSHSLCIQYGLYFHDKEPDSIGKGSNKNIVDCMCSLQERNSVGRKDVFNLLRSNGILECEPKKEGFALTHIATQCLI